MQQRQTHGAAVRVHVHGLEEAHGIEVAVAGHESTLGQRPDHRPRIDRVGHEGNGGGAILRCGRPEQADVPPRREIFEQCREERQFRAAQQVADALGAGTVAGWGSGGLGSP